MAIQIDAFSHTIEEILKTYTYEARQMFEETAMEVARECATELRAVSPKGRSKTHYASGWKAKKVTRGKGKNYWSTVVYNAKKAGLAHLLEHGHRGVGRNGKTYFVEGQVHIKPVEDKYVREYERRVKERLKSL